MFFPQNHHPFINFMKKHNTEKHRNGKDKSELDNRKSNLKQAKRHKQRNKNKHKSTSRTRDKKHVSRPCGKTHIRIRNHGARNKPIRNSEKRVNKQNKRDKKEKDEMKCMCDG
jgi:hypothetical protein